MRTFAPRLGDSLRRRESQVAGEFAAGETLEAVLNRHLRAVESSTDTQLMTSILLLEDGRVWHGAAPSLPKSYRDAIHGAEIGPKAGSCGTAAYLGRSIYVTDIATDPLWADYRELALRHGLRACWSTPIRNRDGGILGTFAVYHLTPRSPTKDEVEAIQLISEHVAQAIEWDRARKHSQAAIPAGAGRAAKRDHLRLVSSTEPEAAGSRGGAGEDRSYSARLQAYAEMFDVRAGEVESPELADALRAVARDCRNLLALRNRLEAMRP